MVDQNQGVCEIGGRARTIRRRRGLSLAVAAGRLGIVKSYLSMLERGERGLDGRRGLLENMADVYGCSVADITGQPYLPGDRASGEALATLPPISLAFFDVTLRDVPDMAARPIDELVRAAAEANKHAADSLYSIAGRDLGAILTELHVHAVTGDGDTRRVALGALVEACIVASGVARSLGNLDLAVIAAARGQEAAAQLEHPGLVGLASMTSTSALSRLGARHRAGRVAATALAQVERNPRAELVQQEAAGMLHLASAQMAAKEHRADDARGHLSMARELADRTGERNSLQFSFGPANVRAWSLSVAVELGDGPHTAEQVVATAGYDNDLPSADRRGALHFDLARAFGQAEGPRDLDALRHLDTADRIAPQRIRNDPLARELLHDLNRRSRMRVWELDSLKRRMGVS